VSRIVGTIAHRHTHLGDRWAISAEPDVMIRLKRLIPGVRMAADDGGISMAATRALARELEWVLSRWDFDMTDEDRSHLTTEATAHREQETLVAEVLAGRAKLKPGTGWLKPAMPLRNYQQLATDLVRANRSALIVDELGLGKTLTSLALLEDPAARPALAVTLTGLAGQWLRELGKFYPDLTGIELRTTNGQKELERICDGDGNVAYDLILINYAKLSALSPHLAGRVNTVIFDEIQELRREDSLKYEGAQRVVRSAPFTAGLSATPVYNYGGEIFNVMNVIQSGCLGSRDEFLREWSGGGQDSTGKVRLKNPEALRAHLKSQGLFLRRTRDDVGISLPAIETVEQLVPANEAVLDELSGNAIEMARLILSQSASRTEKWQSAGELDWRMRQATGIAKAPFVADFVRLLLESEKKVVLFGWHRAVYDIWMERLKAFDPVLYTGTESAAAKAKSYEHFVHGDSRVLVMSLRSGAGLDGLQDVANTIVFGELDWSPGVHRQAIGRLGRPGQKHGVLAYFCVSNHGSDPIILDTLNIKAMESDRLIEPDVTNGTATPQTQTEHIKKLAESVLARATQGSSE